MKKNNIPTSFNMQNAKSRLNETFLYTVKMILNESESLIEAKERIMFQIMQDIIHDHKSYDLGKKYIDKMLKKLKLKELHVSN